MKEYNTYNPDDIEQLLSSKSFEELSSEELEFVMTQVDSEQEYQELRNTLLSILKYSAEQDTIVVPNRIKEELVELMEKKKRPFGWLSLNNLGTFLFPSGTPFYLKPGIQFASIALVLFFVVNIGLDSIENQPGKLAINTKRDIELKPIDSGNSNNEVGTNELNPEDKEENKNIAEIPVPAIGELSNKIEIQEEELSITDDFVEADDAVEIEMIVKNLDTKDVRLVADSAVVSLDFTSQPASAGTENMTFTTLNSTPAFNVDFEKIESTSDRAVTLSEVQVSKGKAKKVKSKLSSQSLKDSEEVIDLLFVAM